MIDAQKSEKLSFFLMVVYCSLAAECGQFVAVLHARSDRRLHMIALLEASGALIGFIYS